MESTWDVFFSYRRHDLDRAQPLLDALAKAGVRVWRDQSDIPDHESITSEIRQGIANSKGLLALYSLTYPTSNPCQQEMTTAWLAAQEIDRDANRRVWIVNPEKTFEHLPELFRDQQLAVIKDYSNFATIAQAVKERLNALDGTFLGKGVRNLPTFYGMSRFKRSALQGGRKSCWTCMGT
jgi:TIR domain-containing protein